MFRFSIQELMVLTLAVALSAGWWAVRSRLAMFLSTPEEQIRAIVRDGQPVRVQSLPMIHRNLPKKPVT